MIGQVYNDILSFYHKPVTAKAPVDWSGQMPKNERMVRL